MSFVNALYKHPYHIKSTKSGLALLKHTVLVMKIVKKLCGYGWVGINVFKLTVTQ